MLHEFVKNIRTIDGHIISLHIFSPTNVEFHQSKCDGVILAVHGLGEYVKRYKHLAEITCHKNKIFAIYDVRGHGENAEKKGDVQNFPCLITDVVHAFNTLKNLFPHIRRDSFSLFGHSFGGLQATYAASILKHEVKKLFLSAPGYSTKDKIAPWKILLANNVANLFPHLIIPIGFNTNNISNNPENNSDYKNDPLVIKAVTARFGKMLLDAMTEENIVAAIENVTAHVTLLIPNDDRVIDSNYTKQISKLFNSLEHVYEVKGAGHEAFNETKNIQNTAFGHYEKWLGH